MENSKVFNKAIEIIKEKGGRCLSKQCHSQCEYIYVECGSLHIWKTNSKNIKNNRWCPVCYRLNISKIMMAPEKKLEEIKKFCIEKGGRCLSGVYTGQSNLLLFE